MSFIKNNTITYPNLVDSMTGKTLVTEIPEGTDIEELEKVMKLASDAGRKAGLAMKKAFKPEC